MYGLCVLQESAVSMIAICYFEWEVCIIRKRELQQEKYAGRVEKFLYSPKNPDWLLFWLPNNKFK
jgi:hypothetical protein